MLHRTALWILATSLVAESARAEAVYLDFSATQGCPTRSEFERQVQARTTLVEFIHEPHQGRFFKIRADGASAVAVGQVTSGRDFEAGSAREVTSPSCKDVVAALALIVALAIDPRAKTTPTINDKSAAAAPASPATAPGTSAEGAVPPTAVFPAVEELSSPSPTAPFAEAPPSATVAPAPPIPARPTPAVSIKAVSLTLPDQGSRARGQSKSLTWSIGPSLGAALWMSSPMTPLGSLGLALNAESSQRTLYAAAARLSISYARSTRVHVAGSGSATFEIWSAEFTYCPLRVELGRRVALLPCAAIEGGQLTATGFTGGVLDHAGPQNRPWGMLSELARMQAWLSNDLQLDVEVGFGEPLGLYRFVFDTLPQETKIAKVPTLVPRLNLGLLWRFL